MAAAAAIVSAYGGEATVRTEAEAVQVPAAGSRADSSECVRVRQAHGCAAARRRKRVAVDEHSRSEPAAQSNVR